MVKVREARLGWDCEMKRKMFEIVSVKGKGKGAVKARGLRFKFCERSGVGRTIVGALKLSGNSVA